MYPCLALSSHAQQRCIESLSGFTSPSIYFCKANVVGELPKQTPCVSCRCTLSSISFQFSDEIQSSLRRIQFSTFDISTFIYTEHNTIERESISCLYPVIKGMFYVEAGDVNGTGSGSGSRLGPGAPSCGKTLKAVTAPSSIEVDNR